MFIPKFTTKKERNSFYTKSVLGVAAFGILLYLAVPLLNSHEVEHFVKHAGPWGPLLIGSYFVLSDVIAPIAGSPGIILSVTLYGLYTGLLIAYISSLISAAINFYISRVFGRALVQRFAGKHAMHQIDHFAEKSGTRSLILGRIFGYPVSELISYAAGLTNISFKKYMIITAIFGAIPAFTIKAMIFYANLRSPASVLVWITILSIVGAIFAFITNKIIDLFSKPKEELKEAA